MVRLPSLELEGLRAVLDRHGFDCVDDAGDADVLVLDEKAAAEAADRRDSDAPVLLIVDPANGDSARAAFTRGIAGTVTRNAASGALVAAINAVAAGFVLISHDEAVAIGFGGHVRRPESPSAQRLSAREREVLRLLGEGDSNKAIAARLNISEHTVKFHVSSILAKLEVVTRTDAVRFGIKHGLIAL